MRKLAAAVLIGVLVGSVGFAANAAARVTPASNVARVTPPHVSKVPFSYTLSGKITVPRLSCPPGVTSGPYCTVIPIVGACSGGVTITISLAKHRYLADGGKTILTKTVPLKPDCSYVLTRTIQAGKLTTTNRAHRPYVRIEFTAQYLGNSVLNPSAAKPQVVLARLAK